VFGAKGTHLGGRAAVVAVGRLAVVSHEQHHHAAAPARRLRLRPRHSLPQHPVHLAHLPRCRQRRARRQARRVESRADGQERCIVHIIRTICVI
jgi:hypothetical protein